MTIPDRLHSGTAGYADIGDLLLGSDVQRLARISYRQLDYWCRLGLLREAVAAQGSGSARAFAADEVRVACVLGRLSHNDVVGGNGRRAGTAALTRLVVEHVREHGLHGTVTSEDGVVVVNLDAVADPMGGRDDR